MDLCAQEGCCEKKDEVRKTTGEAKKRNGEVNKALQACRFLFDGGKKLS